VRLLDSLTPAEIKAVVAEVFPEDGHARDYQVLDSVAEFLGSSRLDEGAFARAYGRAGVVTRFSGRVRRALDALAADGALVRVGGREQPPDGSPPGEVHYYTVAGYKAAAATHEDRQAEAVLERARRHRIASRLSAVNVTLRPDGSLSPGDWEHLLEAAGL
jgi:hypothetical protein